MERQVSRCGENLMVVLHRFCINEKILLLQTLAWMDWIMMQCLLRREEKAINCMNCSVAVEKSLVQGVKEVPYELQVLQYTNTTQCLFTA